MHSKGRERTVYPRPRGGAYYNLDKSGVYRGLSPPTRGSRGGQRRDCVYRGSIPAHAGEPR